VTLASGVKPLCTVECVGDSVNGSSLSSVLVMLTSEGARWELLRMSSSADCSSVRAGKVNTERT
jgi:hypothetical protein